MNFNELAEKRFSCRAMSNKKVEPEKVNQIIETAILAPTAVNRQPFKIFVMDSEKSKKDMEKVTKYTFGAGTFLVIGTDEESAWVRPSDEKNFADVDGSIVATHIMMQIEDLGLSTTWVGFFDEPLLKELYPQMKKYNLIAIFPIGYKAEDAEPSPRHSIRKSFDELVEIL